MQRVGPVLFAGIALSACVHGGLRFDALPATSSAGAVERYGRGLVLVDSSGQALTFELAEGAEVALVGVSPSGRVRALYPVGPGESSRFSAGPHTIMVPVSLEWAPDPELRMTPRSSPTDAWRAYDACIGNFEALERARRPATRAPGDTGRVQQEGPPTQPAWTPASTPGEACGRAPLEARGPAAPPGSRRIQNDLLVLVVSRTAITADGLRRRITALRVRSEADLRELPLWIIGDRIRPWAGYFSRRFRTSSR